MQKSNKIIISASDRFYPGRLTHLASPPKNLHVKGDPTLIDRSPIVGIVGARKVTPYGREVTSMLAADLARAGVTIVSGLALGVDSIAHRSCLEAKGKTIAVLPSGINNIYPASHRGLAEQITEAEGSLISEYDDTQPAMQYRFIERNRIIAALSDVLIITEAAERSGSLHTARFGLEIGRTVMAVPGPINSAYSRGANQLIQNGAVPVLSSSDVLEALGINTEAEKESYMPENEAEATILELIYRGDNDGNSMLQASKLDPAVFQTHLTMLEIKGVIEVNGGLWRVK